MPDAADPAIKLFGRTIPLIDGQTKGNGKENSMLVMPDIPEVVEGDLNNISSSGKNMNKNDQKNYIEGNKVASSDREDKVISDPSNQEKLLKKPEKVLSCPRCNSFDTKFCYYNNYNINQPRHFCKNCQRYWTAGGAMRNVPVGAGKRKNRQTGPNCVPISPSEGVSSDGGQSAPVGTGDTAQSHSFASEISSPLMHSNVGGGLLRFSQDGRSCESKTSFPNVGGENETAESDALASGEPREETSNPSLQAASNCTSENSNLGQFLWNNPLATSAPMSASCSPGIPSPFITPLISGSMSGSINGTRGMLRDGLDGGLTPSTALILGSGSSTLGKHSRGTSVHGEERNENCLWFPKTIRLDDKDAEARSSIWKALGIRSDEQVKKTGVVAGFLSQTSSQGQIGGTTQVFCTNPSALTGFEPFQENR